MTDVGPSLPVALTIAGSDSGGGAGIQADLKTFAFHQVHGTSALTCVTAQNTLGVNRVDALEPASVQAQIMAVADDIGFQAVKTGMLLNQGIIRQVSESLQSLAVTNLVVDPVMVSRAGVQLIDDNAIATLVEQLLPQALVLTPNRFEAQILSQSTIDCLEDMQRAAEVIYRLGARHVLVKGGGMPGVLRGIDVWFDGTTMTVLKTASITTQNTHGTGCTLSAAIAANLALGSPPLEAAHQAKAYVTEALKAALSIGHGQGPVGHFYSLRSR